MVCKTIILDRWQVMEFMYIYMYRWILKLSSQFTHTCSSRKIVSFLYTCIWCQTWSNSCHFFCVHHFILPNFLNLSFFLFSIYLYLWIHAYIIIASDFINLLSMLYIYIYMQNLLHTRMYCYNCYILYL